MVWRVVNWFNTQVGYRDILPIRASTYILSILNEQVGKGAMALYLNRRDGVPGWQLGSSMLFIMFCEFYYLLFWATVGVTLRWEHFPEVFHAIPWIAGGAVLFFALFVLFFRGHIAPGSTLRDRALFHAFRQARPWQYGMILVLRSPALLSAVVVYTLALRMFGVEASFGDMLGYLPVIFFGAATPGPMRSVAIVLWVTLFPGNAGEMAGFGLVQHNFFIFFNAAIGLVFRFIKTGLDLSAGTRAEPQYGPCNQQQREEPEGERELRVATVKSAESSTGKREHDRARYNPDRRRPHKRRATDRGEAGGPVDEGKRHGGNESHGQQPGPPSREHQSVGFRERGG